MKITKNILMTFVLLASIVMPAGSFAETLMGQVLNNSGIPVPGMEVRLFHPGPGLSKPVYTNGDGVFYFSFVPIVPGSYDLEFYWRGNIVFRRSVLVRGNTRLAPLNL